MHFTCIKDPFRFFTGETDRATTMEKQFPAD
jgi:hypothetical protein